jgi:agmatinase
VLEALSALARRRLDMAAGTSWDPIRPLLEGR